MNTNIDKIALKRIQQIILVVLFAMFWVACDQNTTEPTQSAQNDAPKQLSTFNAEGIANLQVEMQDWRSKMPELLAKIKTQSQQSQEERQALVTPAVRTKAAEFKARFQARGQAMQDRKEEPVVTEATQIYVPDDYATIQAAVDAASPGDEIIIRDGEYYEEVVVNTDSLTLKAENYFGVGIYGVVVFGGVTGGKVDGVICFGDGLSSFTGMILAIESSGIAVKNCGVGYGLGIIIYLSNDCNVMDNIAAYNTPVEFVNLGGISFAGSVGSLASGNLSVANGGSGIALLECYDTNVKSNTCVENGFGGPWPAEYNNGIIVFGGSDNHYMKNEASLNGFCGMLLIESHNNKIGPTNTMNENGILGLYLAGSNDNVVQKNTALNNGDCDAVDEGTGNHYTKNNFGCTNF